MAVLAVLLLTAGCASQQAGGGPAAGPSPAPQPTLPRPVRTPGPVDPDPGTPAGRPQPNPRPAPQPTTLVGTVTAGVEPGCLLLAADRGGSWLLLGGDQRVLRVGARVEVTGLPARGVVSTCQQGRPFQVRSARPA
jgi:hypothetical protein